MNYLINFINLLLGKLGSSIAPSSLSSSTHLTATGTSLEGAANLDEHPLLGTTTMSVASAVTSAANEAYDQSNYALNTSQVYVQALNEDELKEFIGKLETYQIEENVEEHPKVLVKTIDKKVSNRL